MSLEWEISEGTSVYGTGITRTATAESIARGPPFRIPSSPHPRIPGNSSPARSPTGAAAH
jgi:hypothetical protein